MLLLRTLASPAKRSGLQREVLKLYADALRMIRTKPEVRMHPNARRQAFGRYLLSNIFFMQDARPQFVQYVRTEFQQHKTVRRTDIARIEHLLRRGRKQLEVLSSPNVQRLGSVPAPRP